MSPYFYSPSGSKFNITIDEDGSLITSLDNSSINYTPSFKPLKPRLAVAKPNMQIISNLKEAYNIQYSKKLTELSELTFSIPFIADEYLDLVDNENVDLLKEKYLIRLTIGTKEEWFIINHITDSSSDTDVKEIHAYSLAYELVDKNIRSFTTESVNANDTLTELLSETVWGIDYIDSIFTTRYRSMDISSATVLDALTQVAETFNALLYWDTRNRRVSLYQPENIGADLGMTFSYRKYLNSVSQETNADEMVTRLRAYGKDGLTFSELSPTGSNFIEDFSYFMYPFEQDDKGNVLSHSAYMTDELCKAMISYDTLINSNATKFANLLSQQSTLQAELTSLQNTLDVLNIDMTIILNSLDVAKSLNDTATIDAKNIEKANKQVQIDDQTALVNSKKSELTANNTDIINLKNLLSIESNFSPALIAERSLYIIEKEWSDDRVTNANDLYSMAKDKIKEIRTPQISASVDIVNFFEMVSESDDWGRLNIGDTIRVKHEKSKIDLKARVTEINFDFENKSIQVTITNVRKTKDQNAKILDLLYQGASTSNQVSMNKYKWDGANEAVTTMSEWFNSEFNAVKQTISGGVHNSVEISERGIIVRDTTDPMKLLVMQNGVLALSNDGSNTWKTAITPGKIVADVVAGTLLVGEELSMENESGRFVFNKDGVVIDNSSFTITGNGTNGLKIDTVDGLVVTKSDNKSKTTINSQGFAIAKSTDGSTWDNVLFTDSNGALNLIDSNISVTKSDKRAKTSISTNGFSISKSTDGTTWTDVFYTDGNGNLNLVDSNISIKKTDNTSKIDINAKKGILISKSPDNGATWSEVFSVDTNGDLNITGKIVGSEIQGGIINGVTITGVDIKGTNGIGVINPNGEGASVALSWLNDIPRIRYGGSGAGGTNGFAIMGAGDSIKFMIKDDGFVENMDIIAPSLGSSWVNFGGEFEPAGYWKDKNSVVHISGTIKNGVTTNGTTLFTLPTEYRPISRQIFSVLSGGDVAARVDVYPTGEVKLTAINSGTNAYLSLAGISFKQGN